MLALIEEQLPCTCIYFSINALKFPVLLLPGDISAPASPGKLAGKQRRVRPEALRGGQYKTPQVIISRKPPNQCL